MDEIERVYYIIETAQNGWSRDTMLTQIANGYISGAGKKNSLEKVARMIKTPLKKWREQEKLP